MSHQALIEVLWQVYCNKYIIFYIKFACYNTTSLKYLLHVYFFPLSRFFRKVTNKINWESYWKSICQLGHIRPLDHSLYTPFLSVTSPIVRSSPSLPLLFCFIDDWTHKYDNGLRCFAICLFIRSPDSVVCIATGYGLHRGFRFQVPVGSQRRPDRHWGPPSSLSNGYQGLFPREKRRRGVKLTTRLQLVPRSRKYGSIHPLSHTPSRWRA
jgi:hypothetical protein